MREALARLGRWKLRLLLRFLSLFWKGGNGAPIKRVIVMEMTRLGDLVAATSMIEPLRAVYPGCRFEIWAREAYAPLFEGDTRLEFQGLPGPGPAFLAAAWKLRRELRQGGLLLVSASPSIRHSVLALLSKPAMAAGFLFQEPGGLGYDEAQPLETSPGSQQKLQSGSGDHLVLRAQKVLSLLNLSSAGPSLRSKEERQPKLAVLHAGANWAWRRWPLERFEALKAALEAKGWKVELVAAEADPSKPQPGLAQFKDLAARASLFVGNDSGPMHMAAALGTPCLGLFGPNLPERSGPWGSRHRTLRHPVPCSPCAQTVCVQPHDWCMRKIEVSEVEETITKMEIPA